MGWANKLIGWATGNGVEVTTQNRLKADLETNAIVNAIQIGGVRMFSEVDQGYQTGAPVLASPEVDIDYRLRSSLDTLLDEEIFNYTAQNTGKHQSVSTTMAATWTAGQFTANSGAITTTTTGYFLKTYASFPNIGTSVLSADFEFSFSAQPSANNFVEFGFAPDITSATAAPSDGVFFRLNSAGLQGIASFNGSEATTGVFTGVGGAGTWAYTNSKRYQGIVYVGAVEAQFWVNDGTNTVMMGSIPLPTGTGRVAMGAGLRAFFGQRITGGAAGAVMQANLNAYSVRLGGPVMPSHNFGNRVYGSYQGLGGGTMGSLANYANNANPTAGVPTNTTAVLGTGLGGQFWETATLAATTDGIICSYQVPTPTVNVQGRRLVLKRVKIDSYVQTALTGGGFNEQWVLCFGHTSVSLATTEATNTKAPRRVVLGARTVAAAAAALTQLSTIELDLSAAPVYVNPGEFIAVAKKIVGTAATAGVFGHTIAMIFDWE